MPGHHGSTITLIALLSVNGMGEAFILDGAVNVGAYARYVEQVLVLSLQPGQTVMMDNWNAHLDEYVRQAIEAKEVIACTCWPTRLIFRPVSGHSLSEKPAYGARCSRTEALQVAIAEALGSIMAQDGMVSLPAVCILPTRETFSLQKHNSLRLKPFDYCSTLAF